MLCQNTRTHRSVGALLQQKRSHRVPAAGTAHGSELVVAATWSYKVCSGPAAILAECRGVHGHT